MYPHSPSSLVCADTNGDGVISLDEMTHYLENVFRVVYDTVPGTAERIGVSAEELAAATAQHCFAEADANGDGTIEYDEFVQWFGLTGGAIPSLPSSLPPTHLQGDVQSAADADLAVTQQQVRDVLGLDQYDVNEVFDTFKEQSLRSNNVLEPDHFYRALALLVHASGRSMSDPNVMETAAKLFDVLDRDGDGTLTFHELATGLTIFCAGSTDSKVRAAFMLYGTLVAL